MVVMVAEEDFTAAVEADSAVARQEVSVVAEEVTMATAADIPTPVTTEVATTVATAVMVATMEVATTVDTVGTADIGAIHTTVMEGVGDGALALGGRIGDGDIRMAMATALRIPLPTLTTTLMIVLRDTHVLPTGTLRLRIPAQNPGATQQILGDRR
jgi:hypothetical protein